MTETSKAEKLQTELCPHGISPWQACFWCNPMMSAHGEDRLVRPAGPGTKPIESPKGGKKPSEDQSRIGGGDGSGSEPPAIDPIIMGLLKRLPKSGDVWPESDRKLWLQLIEGSFKLIYKDKDDREEFEKM